MSVNIMTSSFHMFIVFLSLTLSLTFAKRGEESKYVIIVPQMDDSAQNASHYLSNYIKDLTTVEIPVKRDTEYDTCPEFCILIGNTSFTMALMTPVNFTDEDSFHLEAKDNKFIVYGGLRGCHYGVMELLERFGGVRWLALDQTHIPSIDNFTVDIELEDQTPAFALRSVWWSAINKGSRAYNCRLNHQHVIPKQQGGSIQWGGGWNVHTFFIYMPPNKYFNDHPEWYSLINGRRISTGQLCISNRDMRAEMCKNLIEVIQNDKNRVPGTVYSVSQNDNGDACQCEECKKIKAQYGNTESGIICWMDNIFAEEVEKAFPGEKIYIEFLSYWYTIDAPQNIKPRWNVIPRLCPINNDMTRPFNESSAEINKRFAKQMESWRKISDNLMIWDYTGAFQQMVAFYPNMYSLQGNIQLFQQHKAMAIFSQGSNDHSFFSELKTYVIAKMLWNTQINFTAVCDEFIELYYGKAAPQIKQFLIESHKVVLDIPDILMHCEMIVTDVNWFDSHIEGWMKLFEEAAEAVKGDPLMEYHLYKTRVSVMFMRYSRIFQERASMRFSWTANGDSVMPVNTPAESAYLGKWLMDCIQSPRYVRLGEIEWRDHDELLKIDISVHGYNITRISDDKFTAGVSVDYTGRLGYLIAKSDNFNYIDGNFGGIEIGNKPVNITGLFVVKTDRTFLNTSSIEVNKHEVSGECKIRKKYTLNNEGLILNVTFSADDWQNTNIRAVSSFAFVLGDAGNVLIRIEDGEYQEYVASKGQHNMYFSVDGSLLKGKSYIHLCSPVSKRCIMVSLPNVTFEHLVCFAYPDNATVRAIFTQPTVTLKPLETDKRGNWFIKPIDDVADLPAPTKRDGHKDDSIFDYIAEDSKINAKAGSLVVDQKSNLTYAAKLFCNTTEQAISKDLDYQNISQSHEVQVHAKISSKEGQDDLLKVVIKCGTNESFSSDLNSSLVVEDEYQWYSFGDWKMEENCQLTLHAGKGAKAISIDEFKLSYVSPDDGDDDDDDDGSESNKKMWIAIGIVVSVVVVIVIVVTIILVIRKRNRDNGENVLNTQKLISE